MNRLLPGIAFLFVGFGSLVAEDWPQFRGPNCAGLSATKQALPVEFSPTKNLAWSAELGDGIGSPTVAAGRVFSTAFLEGKNDDKTDGKKLVVFCFDAASGKKLWQRDIPAGTKPLPYIHETNSYASSSPAADSERVYVYFARSGLHAFAAQTGEQVWHVALPEPFFIFDWGPGMSPVFYQDTLYFCQDDDLSPQLIAVDKRTGKILWRDDRSDMAVSYSHPVICQTPAGPELVVAGTGKVLGYDPATGKRKWAAELYCRNIKSTPASKDGVVYLALESTGISYQWRATADPDGTGKITRESIKASRKDKGASIPEAFWKKFERGDVNKDGVLEGDEIDKAFLDPSNQGGILHSEVRLRAGDLTDWRKWDATLQSEAFLQAVRAGGQGDVTKTHVPWKIKSKAPDGIVSPLVVGNRMLVVKSGGLISAFDTKQGERLWNLERLGLEGRIFASPVHGDSKIYVVAQNGDIAVLADTPEFNVLARNSLGEPSLATPAIADGRLFIRTRTKLYCFGANDGR
jgi:outer membrane protein assembly factor BamB